MKELDDIKDLTGDGGCIRRQLSARGEWYYEYEGRNGEARGVTQVRVGVGFSVMGVMGG